MASTLRERFEAKVGPENRNGCRLWLGYLNRDGYGHFQFATRNSRLAHRVAWELAHGPIPEGLHVLHRCDTPGCVAVNHLSLGTHLDNMKDMVAKGRSRSPRAEAQAAKTHCPKGHPYSGDNLYVYPHGDRKCRTCHRVNMAFRRSGLNRQKDR